MRIFGFMSAALLLTVSPSHAADKYVCPNGKTISTFDHCPTVKKWGAPSVTKKQDVRISGLSDEIITGSFVRSNNTGIVNYIADEFATDISLDLKGTGSEFSKIGVMHGEIDRRVWLHVSGSSSPNESGTVSRYRARLDSFDRYQIHKPDGSRLRFEECLMTEVLQEALANPNSDIEFVTSCKNS